jgi:hypothetical protein
MYGVGSAMFNGPDRYGLTALDWKVEGLEAPAHQIKVANDIWAYYWNCT